MEAGHLSREKKLADLRDSGKRCPFLLIMNLLERSLGIEDYVCCKQDV